mmetsp:Transcript_126031/g.362516  ORF Transcript_126031/g.362516 Transcript_126031/m.362516 type:complete len:205 (+) Transcript_126031:516-1130(+)
MRRRSGHSGTLRSSWRTRSDPGRPCSSTGRSTRRARRPSARAIPRPWRIPISWPRLSTTWARRRKPRPFSCHCTRAWSSSWARTPLGCCLARTSSGSCSRTPASCRARKRCSGACTRAAVPTGMTSPTARKPQRSGTLPTTSQSAWRSRAAAPRPSPSSTARCATTSASTASTGSTPWTQSLTSQCAWRRKSVGRRRHSCTRSR